MASSSGIANVHVQKHRHEFSRKYILVWLVTLAYVFDTVVSLTLPSNALIGIPQFYKQVWEEFQNPLTLFGIFLASLCEIFVMSKAIPALRYRIRSFRAK